MDKKLKLFLKKYEEEIDFDSQSIMPEGCKVLMKSKHRSRNKCVLASVISSCTCVAVALGIAVPLSLNYGFSHERINGAMGEKYIISNFKVNDIELLYKSDYNENVFKIFTGIKDNKSYIIYLSSFQDASYHFSFLDKDFSSINPKDIFGLGDQKNFDLSFEIEINNNIIFSSKINIKL